MGNRVDVQFVNSPCNDEEEGDYQESHPLVMTTVRASFSLVMHTSPITETALRTIESSLVHCADAQLTTQRLQQFPTILPYLIRADCARLFQQTVSDNSDGDGSRSQKKKLTPIVEDDCWYALTVVLLNLLGMKSDDDSQQPSTMAQTSLKPKKPSAWENLLQSDFHFAFSQGEGQMLFGESDLEDLSVDSAYNKNDHSAVVGGGGHLRSGPNASR